MAGHETPSGVILKIKKKAGAVVPQYETSGAAGLDLRAFISSEIIIPPSAIAKVPTGLFMEIPEGYEGQVRPRSGLAARSGITVLNAPGTIDSDYRGEVEVILINHGTAPFTVRNNDRIAQLVLARTCRAEITETDSLEDTKRGAGGFGSTGV